MGLYPELDTLDAPELGARFWSAPPDGEDYAFAFFSEVALCLRRQGKPGTDFLVNSLDNADEDRLRAILFALSSKPKLRHVEIVRYLISFLRDERSQIVAEAIDGLAGLGIKRAQYDVLGLQHHPSPYVRGAVLRFVSRQTPKCAPLLLIGALGDQHHLVRENAVDELDALGITAAMPQIRPLLDDPYPDVREAARTALDNLAELRALPREDHHQPRAG